MNKQLIYIVISLTTVAFALTLGAQVGGGDIVMKNSEGNCTTCHKK